MRTRAATIVLAGVLAATGGTSRAAILGESPAPGGRSGQTYAAIVVFDLREPDNGPVVAPDPEGRSVFITSYQKASRLPVECTKLPASADVSEGHLAGLLRCANGGSLEAPAAEASEVRVKAAKLVADVLQKADVEPDFRIPSHRGDLIVIAVLSTAMVESQPLEVVAGTPEILFQEKLRRKQIVGDLGTLVRLGAAIAGKTDKTPSDTKAVQAQPTPWAQTYSRPLRLERASLTIKASLKGKATGRLAFMPPAEPLDGLSPSAEKPGEKPTEKPGEKPAEKPGEKPAEKPAEPALEVVLTTGPSEHWYLSADVPLSGKTHVQIGADGASLGEKPSGFYVGLNLLAGDVLASRRTLLGNVALKLLIKASSRPQESVGLGLGLRGTYLKFLGIDFETLSPFVFITFDEPAGGGGRRRSTLRAGASLNLGKALDWVK